MSSARMTTTPRPSISPQQDRDIRARAWAFVFECYHKKEATRPGGPNDAKESEVGCAARKQYTK
jgi:hypothetical protein